jgi:DNA-binding response OmpR family regulator
MILPKSVVVVEDEMMAQRYLKDILGNFGVENVKAFTNAQDALEWLNTSKCDMLLADINLKGSIDGIQMAKAILRKHDIPIIFITAYSDSETLNDALSISPFGYIVKPFSQSDIELQVRIGYQKYLQYKEQGNNKGNTYIENLKIIKINDMLEFSLTNNTLSKNGKQIYLPHKQNELVAILCKNLNNVVSYEQLEYMLWQDESHAGSALRTLVYSLRNIIPELQIILHSKIGYSVKSS